MLCLCYFVYFVVNYEKALMLGPISFGYISDMII